MEAPDGYSASKSPRRLHLHSCTLTVSDQCFTPKEQGGLCFPYRSVCLCFTVLSKLEAMPMVGSLCLYCCAAWFIYFDSKVSSNLIQKHNNFCNHRPINTRRDFPLVQPFSCSPLKGREDDALATSCWMQQILDMHFVVLHCPLLVSFGQVGWIASLPVFCLLWHADLKTGNALFVTSVGILRSPSGVCADRNTWQAG